MVVTTKRGALPLSKLKSEQTALAASRRRCFTAIGIGVLYDAWAELELGVVPEQVCMFNACCLEPRIGISTPDQ
jgi:hypothetical protein